MAMILGFRPRTAQKPDRAPPEGGATIIIFPGVRYERLDGRDDRRGSAAGMRRERKHRRKG
ncbi:hypothetical protein [Chelativorans sp.]|uniref:hypothetical protein n=1 Tax=Chelativorans sp. TaxID=2203393 RepID=UPI002810F64D|nr:hypothetical protein [Chelativorans sp.]